MTMLLRLVGIAALLGAVPVWANSVEVAAYSYPDAYTPGAPFDVDHSQCTQAGSSSASCEASFSSLGFNSRFGGDASAYASASFGSLSGQVNTVDFGSSARAAASFSDDVLVTGGTGTGTLIAHYTVAIGAESNYATPDAGGFVFLQGATRSGVTPTQFTDFGFRRRFRRMCRPGVNLWAFVLGSRWM